jgi:polyhydroxyalkanoate synthesis repressor PhaR
LDDIHRLIKDGNEVRIIESRTEEDITSKVLAQIILEFDAPKVGLFPAALLHQVIRANEPLIRDFIEKYFNQALSAFLHSQQQFAQFLRQSLGLHTGPAPGLDWGRMMMTPLWPAFLGAHSSSHHPLPSTDTEPKDQAALPDEEADVRESVEQLRQQLKRLEARMPRKR